MITGVAVVVVVEVLTDESAGIGGLANGPEARGVVVGDTGGLADGDANGDVVVAVAVVVALGLLVAETAGLDCAACVGAFGFPVNRDNKPKPPNFFRQDVEVG